MNIKKLLTLLSVSLVLMPAITWAMELTEEEQIALAMEASIAPRTVLPTQEIDLARILEASEIEEALRRSKNAEAAKNARPAVPMSQEEKEFNEAIKISSQLAADHELAKRLNAENAQQPNVANLSEEEQILRAMAESTKTAKPQRDTGLINRREEKRKNALKEKQEQERKKIQDLLNKRDKDATRNKKDSSRKPKSAKKADALKTALNSSFDNIKYISTPEKSARSYDKVIAPMQEYAEDQNVAIKLFVADAIRRYVNAFIVSKAFDTNTLRTIKPTIKDALHEDCVIGTLILNKMELKDGNAHSSRISLHIQQFLAKPIMNYFVKLAKEGDKLTIAKADAKALNAYLQVVTKLGVLLLTCTSKELATKVAPVVEQLTEIKDSVDNAAVKEQLEYLVLYLKN